MRIFNRTGRNIFFIFLPSHPHTCGSNVLFIGVSSVRVSFFTLTLALTPSLPQLEAPCVFGGQVSQSDKTADSITPV